MAEATRQANWRYFAVVLIAASLAWAALLAMLDGFTSIRLPDAAGIGVYVAAVSLAGHRFAAATSWTWTSSDRNRLAVAYALVSVPVVAVFLSLSIVFAAVETSTAQVLNDLSQPSNRTFLILIVALTFPLNYLFTRFFLTVVKPTDDSRKQVRMGADEASQ